MHFKSNKKIDYSFFVLVNTLASKSPTFTYGIRSYLIISKRKSQVSRFTRLASLTDPYSNYTNINKCWKALDNFYTIFIKTVL